MSNNDDIKNEAYNRLVEAVHEWATARRLEIKNNHDQQSPMDIDIVQEYENGYYEHEHVDHHNED